MDVPYERDADIMVCLRGISIATITPEDIAALLLAQAFGGRIFPLTVPGEADPRSDCCSLCFGLGLCG